MLKVLQARLQQYVNHELPVVQAGFREGRGTRDQIANICWIIKKARVPEKAFISALLTMPKPLFVCGSQQTLENSERDVNSRPPDRPLEKSVCRSGSKLELDMAQQTGSKQEKEYIKAVYCHPAYLTSMQSTS